MSDSQFVNVGSLNASSFINYPLVGTNTGVEDGSEAFIQLGMRVAGTFRYMFAYVSNATDSVDRDITLRKNLANTAITVTYDVAQTGIKEKTSPGVSVAATDEFNWQLSGTDLTWGIEVLGIKFTPSIVTTVVELVAIRGPVGLSASMEDLTFYNAMNGEFTTNTAEAQTKFSAGQTLVAQKFYSYASANIGSANVTLRSRLNGANGNMVVTYTSGQTGVKEDTVNTDSISIGDDFNFSVTVLDGANITVEIQSCHMVKSSSTQVFFPLMASSSDGASIDFNLTRYNGVAGDLIFNATEANTQIRPRFTFTARQLGTYVTANTIATSATDVYVRDKSANSTVTVSYDAAQTGLKTDNTHTTSIASGTDRVNYSIVTPNTSGAITFTYIGLLSKAEGISKSLFIYQAVNRAATY